MNIFVMKSKYIIELVKLNPLGIKKVAQPKKVKKAVTIRCLNIH